jgi:endonuclease/exonuclease/phosphatase family metal-dependent hydrolase
MRIGTWNLNAKWSDGHAALLYDQAADIWCLTEVPTKAITDGQVAGYPAVGSTGRMSRGQVYAVIAARVAPMAARCPHPATVVADVGGITVASSVLPWATAGGQPAGVWVGGRVDEWMADALAAIRPSCPTVWAGDWNATLAGGSQRAGSTASVAAVRAAVPAMGLTAPTAPLPHYKPGLLAIDHIAVPVSWRVLAARRVAVGRLSDHDAYVVDAEPGL